MERRLFILLALMLTIAVMPMPPRTIRAADPGKLLMAYYPEWQAQSIKRIPAEKLSHLLYAFSLVNAAGECTPLKASAFPKLNLKALRTVKAQHPHLKVFISIGGWEGSAHFSKSALTEESRARLVRSCIDMWIRPGGKIDVPGVIDGVDIDWEYPGAPGATRNYRPEDKQNFVLLLREFRRQLDEQGALDGKYYGLSAAVGPAPKVVEAGLDLPALAEVLDTVHLMTYDLHGPGEPSGPTNFHNALYPANGDPSPAGNAASLNVDSAVQRFLAGGFPPEKIVIGIPYYARGWKDVPPENSGLFQPAGGNVDMPYRLIAEQYESRASKYRHPEARVPWLYDAQERLFLSYDDPESVREKAEYVLSHNLGGAMFWELSQDDAQFALTTALCERLGRSGCVANIQTPTPTSDPEVF